jgi:hypothetical protein
MTILISATGRTGLKNDYPALCHRNNRSEECLPCSLSQEEGLKHDYPALYHTGGTGRKNDYPHRRTGLKNAYPAPSQEEQVGRMTTLLSITGGTGLTKIKPRYLNATIALM